MTNIIMIFDTVNRFLITYLYDKRARRSMGIVHLPLKLFNRRMVKTFGSFKHRILSSLNVDKLEMKRLVAFIYVQYTYICVCDTISTLNRYLSFMTSATDYI